MRIFIGIVLLFLFLSVDAQNKEETKKGEYEPFRIEEIKETGDEPYHIYFGKDEIYIDDKVCFNYELKHNVMTEYGYAPNYFKIISLEGNVIFSGMIKKNKKGVFEGTISFPLIEKYRYRNSRIVGRNDLILHLSSNQVINSNCSVNIDNLRLFYELSNEAEK